MSKFRSKYNWKDRPIAQVLPNGEFDARSWLMARVGAVAYRYNGRALRSFYREYFKNHLSNTEKISRESVGDAL